MRILSAALALSFAGAVSAGCSVNPDERIDCGYAGITQSQCEAKGCCWGALSTGSSQPWCFYSLSGYYLSSSLATTSTGYSGTLKLSAGSSVYGADISQLSLDVIYESNDYIHVRMTDSSSKRWEVPKSVISRPTATTKASNPAYTFTYQSSPFKFSIVRKSDGFAVFDMGSNLVFKDQFIQIPVNIDTSAATYGLGESTRSTQKLQAGTTYTLWARDFPAAGFNSNLYGAHPFYLQVVNGKAHGVFLLNSNGMDITVASNEIVFKTTGGMIDLYVFTGPTPADVVKQYLAVVGKPAMQPYWSLGFHNCKYGYTSIWEVEDVVTRYQAANIPLDTQWVDIDYMEAFKDFTVDPVNFPLSEMRSFVSKLHSSGQHFVPIIDPGIMVQNGYNAYTSGVSSGIFIKDITGGYYLGQVWPGPTYFPDFLHPSIESYWTTQLQSFHDMVSYDGIWIDMNEIANFCNVDGRGQVCQNKGGCPGSDQTACCLVCSTVDGSNKYDFPPYNIANGYGLLSTKTIAMSSVHYGNISEYDAHNLYGLTEAIATNAALRTIRGQRPFLLSRSSFASSGKHTSHWTGDNAATWNDLKASIPTILNFALFGVPMVGADICGFIGDTTEELCARWAAVGSFYPFSRNHNAIYQKNQEYYLWPSVTAAAQNALGMRYRMLPYLYTLFHKANQNGEMVARSLWVNFPSDSRTYDISTQFMLGDGILVSPALDQGVTTVTAYFPQGVWYSFSDYSKVDATAGAVTTTLSTPLTAINVHMRGGVIIPTQQGGMTTVAARTTPFTLVVPLGTDLTASGSLFLDDGEQIDLIQYAYISYAATSNSVTGAVNANTWSGTGSVNLETVVVLGITSKPSSAVFNGVALASSQIAYDSSKQALTFSSLKLPMSSGFTLYW